MPSLTEKQARLAAFGPLEVQDTCAGTKGLGVEDSDYPYRTPTQVGWLRKPRWTSEPRLRNSARMTP